MALARTASGGIAAPKTANGVSLAFLHAFRESEAAQAVARLSEWSAERCFTDPATGEISATPRLLPGFGWAVTAWLPKGRSTYITLSLERADLNHALAAHLPDFNGGDLSASQREQAVASWMPSYKVSTRAVWDEAVDPLMFTGAAGYDLRDSSLRCYADKLRRDGHAEAVGDASMFVSHALDNSFSSLDDALMYYAKRAGLDPERTFVLLDGFCVAQEDAGSDQHEHFASIFMQSINACDKFVLVSEPWSNPKPLTRCWCVWEMWCAVRCDAAWEIVMGPDHEAEFGRTLREVGAEEVLQAIRDMDVTNAVAYWQEDEKLIHDAIRNEPAVIGDDNSGWTGTVESGHQRVNSAIKLILRKTLSECATRLMAELDKEVGRLPEPTTLAQKLKRQLFCTRGEEVTADLFYERGEQMLDEAEILYRSILQKRQELAAEVVADLGVTTTQDGDGLTEEQVTALIFTQQMVVSVHGKLGRLCYDRGDYGGAEECFCNVLSARPQLQAFESAFANAKMPDEIRSTLHRDSDENEAVYTKLLLVSAKASMLRAENGLALIASAKGDLKEAERLLRSVIKQQEVALRQQRSGQDKETHEGDSTGTMDEAAADAAARDVVDSKSNLVSLLRTSSAQRGGVPARTGDGAVPAGLAMLEEAEELQLSVVNWRLHNLGPSHPASLDAQVQLAVLQEESGKKEAGEALLKEVLNKQTELLGESHMDTLATHNSLATLYAQRNDYTSAQVSYETLLPQLEHVLGKRHPNTLSTYRSLGTVLASMGEHTRAVDLLSGVVDAQATVLGPTHPDLEHSTKLLAQVQSMQASQVEATAVFRAIDTDNSGSISMSELTIRLGDFGLTDESVELVATQLMTMMDVDGDGEINESEWLHAYPAWQKLQAQIDGL